MFVMWISQYSIGRYNLVSTLIYSPLAVWRISGYDKRVRNGCYRATSGICNKVVSRRTGKTVNKHYGKVVSIYGFHQGASPVRKSVSVHGLRTILLSALVSTWARASESGAGPLITFPSLLYCDPWHGHMYLFSALFHGTTHPRCVQTAFKAKSARFFDSSRIR